MNPRTIIRIKASVRATRFAFLILAILLGLSMTTCAELWGPMDDPADPKASSYQGYEKVADPDAIRTVAPADGGTLSGTILTATKVSVASAYELAIGTSAAALESAPFYQNAGYSSNVMDISAVAIQNQASYWWKVRAIVGSTPGAWSSLISFKTEWSTPAATPSFSPAAGTYTSDKSVTLSCATSGNTIYYTLDGSTPTTASAQYGGAISVAGHGTVKTIKAIATATGFVESAVGSATYTITYPAVATPAFSPAGGNYTTDKSVTLSCATSGNTIYYTLDGSAPTTASTQYIGGAISVSGHGTVKTIKAIATAAGYAASEVGSATYTISYPAVATPTFSSAGGTYTTDKSVTLSCTTSGSTIYYTLDGSTPTTASAQYGGAISVAGHGTVKTIKAIATAPGYSSSAIGSATYTITYPAAATPSFNPASGTYTTDKSVTLSCTTSGSTIYYTLDGSAPTTASAQYGGAISVAGHGTVKTIKAIATAAGYAMSEVGSETYTINYPAATPTFSPAAGTYTIDKSVTLSCATSGNTIYYTLDGSTPTTASAQYGGAISVAKHGTVKTIKAIATATGFSSSAIGSATYTISYPAAAAPSFSPSGGSYTSTQSVTITCATTGSTIWYTTDGSDPAISATRFSGSSPRGPLSVPLGMTLRAVATATGYSSSTEGMAGYSLIWMLPVPGGSFHNGTSTVTLSSFTMSKYEVTQDQYRTVTGNSPSYFTGNTSYPVEQVTWYDAVEFCNKLSTSEGLSPVYTIYSRAPAAGYPITDAVVTATWTNSGYRLPTEAEWEYAARGGTSTQNYIYAGSNTIDDVAWYDSNSGTKTHPVGGKMANELGFFDMSGNIWEWCWDWYGIYPNGNQTVPRGAALGTNRVSRGGCLDSLAYGCTVSSRNCPKPQTIDDNYGFRVVRPSSQ
jgi:formylglycine-generating enzyme required for sulfatase activity